MIPTDEELWREVTKDSDIRSTRVKRLTGKKGNNIIGEEHKQGI